MNIKCNFNYDNGDTYYLSKFEEASPHPAEEHMPRIQNMFPLLRWCIKNQKNKTYIGFFNQKKGNKGEYVSIKQYTQLMILYVILKYVNVVIIHDLMFLISFIFLFFLSKRT